MSSSSNLLSHPEILLKDHLETVGNIAKETMASKKLENSELYTKIAYFIGISHDFAKATTFFQELLKQKKRTRKANHSFLSAIFGYYIVEKYLEKIEKLEDNEFLPLIAFIVIRSHHGNLPNLHGENSLYNKFLQKEFDTKELREQLENTNQQEVIDIYDHLLKSESNLNSKLLINDFYNEMMNSRNSDEPEIITKIIALLKKISRKKDLANYFMIMLHYSVLIDADKITASGTEIPERIENIPKMIVEHYKQTKFGKPKLEINIIREQAFCEALKSATSLDLHENKRILTLTLPTGCGKTLTGLASALLLRDRIKETKKLDFVPKIIYSLPFLSIIDQNSRVFDEILNLEMPKISKEETIPSNLMLKHHHLAEIAYFAKTFDEIIELPISQSLLLTESWHSEIVITTFVQFFHSLISYRNRTSRKFHNITNSVIILDEIQSIPHKYWLIIKEMLEFLAENFNCLIILMTPTNPLIFKTEETVKLIRQPEEYFKKFDRIKINYNHEPLKFNDFKGQLLEEILATDNDIMVILNTINTCKELYQFIRDELEQERTETYMDNFGIWISEKEELYCLSTHIIPKHRLEKIRKIAGIDDKKKKRRIIITTQLVEAGVDVSVDKIYRDFAPLDCIIQAAGRCNRNNRDQKGLVEIIRLQTDNKKEFCDYIYDRTLTAATDEILREAFEKNNWNIISEHEFIFSTNNSYFDTINNRKSDQKSRELYEKVAKLRFKDLSAFQLIEDRGTIPIYIEVNPISKEIRERFEEELEDAKGYGKRAVRVKYKEKINDYTTSAFIRKKDVNLFKTLPEVASNSYMLYVPQENLDEWYTLDIGLWLQLDSSINMRML